MIGWLDKLLDKITMYRLVLYSLIGLLVLAVIFGLLGLLPYSPGSIVFSTALILFLSLVTNEIFSRVFSAPTNVESVYITALILALIAPPFKSFGDLSILIWAPVLANASKYILAINRKHVFNPAAIAVALTALWLGDSASWWVGTAVMAPFVFASGIAIVRKIEREDMVWVFFIAAFMTEEFFTLFHGGDITATIRTLVLHSSMLFFAFIMLTEPFTTPPTKQLRLFYAALVGFLFSPHIHFGSLYSTPELALVVGNVYSYLVSPNQKLFLHLKDRINYGKDTVDLVFSSGAGGRMEFKPGQYMEWTLPHLDPDSRGNRRYFTLASSPTEDDVHLGVKFYPQGSSFKKALANITVDTLITAGNLAGDFTLPDDKNTKLAFISGGIGVTPFRSIIKYCLDTRDSRQIVHIYSNKTADEIAYRDVFDEGEKSGIKTIYTLTDEKSVPRDWNGRVGRVSAEMVKEIIPDYQDRIFYLSGPHKMVEGYEQLLREIGVPDDHIKKDFFPGYV